MSEGAVTRWLRRAPRWAFALYGGLAAFGTYSAMYAFRKPFAAASYAGVIGWSGPVDFKTALVIAQVLGYALSKLIGVKLIAEMGAARRGAMILTLIALAGLALVGFVLLPPVAGIAMLFVNGLMLGMIWGLVFGFLEGRRLSEVLGTMLCASFVLSSGVVKSVGSALIEGHVVPERWMPAATGLAFTPLLLLCVWALAQLPPPDAADIAERRARVPMDAGQRHALLRAQAPSLIALVAVYVLLTAFRDFRDSFAVEIWRELGERDVTGLLTWSELPVSVVVLAALATIGRVRDNVAAVFWNLGLIALGLAIVGLATLAFQAHALGPIAWMTLTGAGLYLAYTPFNALLFDRFMAATCFAGNAGFLIYVADAAGYGGSVALLLVRTLGHVDLPWTRFLCDVGYVMAVGGLAATALAAWLLAGRLGRERDAASVPTDAPRLAVL